MNLFATVLTYTAPSNNYRGESELNRTVIQKVTEGKFDYPIISPEAMRNALREILAKYDLPYNRKRIEPRAGEEDEKQQLAVEYKKYPDPDAFADDFFFGYLLAVKGEGLKKLRKEKGKDFPLKRDSVLRMNLAKALEPYRYNAVFNQSPKLAKDNPWQVGEKEGGTSSALLHRETAVTAFQYPFAINANDCACKDSKCDHKIEEKNSQTTCKRQWTRMLLKAIGELNGVAGNHGRSYYEMAPASIVLRLSESLVAGYNTYGFQISGQAPDDTHHFREIVDGVLRGTPVMNNGPRKNARGQMEWQIRPDYPPEELYIGGKIVRDLQTEHEKVLAEHKQRKQSVDGPSAKSRFALLEEYGVTLHRDPRELLSIVARKALGE